MTEEPSPSVPRRPRPLVTPSPRVRGRDLRLVAGIVLILYSWVMALAVPLPFVKQQPGSATDVLQLIHVDGGPEHAAEGALLFLTVSISQRITPAEAVLAWLDPDVEVRPEEDYTHGIPRDELTRLNLAVMERSKSIAIKVALEHLGYEVPVEGGGAVVSRVRGDRPAGEVLRKGDVVTAVDGERVVRSLDLISVVREARPGDSMVLTVQRDGEELEISVATVEGDDGVAQIGIELLDADLEYQFPFGLDINTGRVGGPSAGLAFTLAVLDGLTPGELTGSKRVAVTGTMEDDGSVRPVGGVAQKAVAARRAGAVLMLVPTGEVEQARRNAGSMDVVAVGSLDDALEALASIGGNALALPRDAGASEMADQAAR